MKLHQSKTWELMNCPVCRADAVITSKRGGGPRKWGVNAEHQIWCDFEGGWGRSKRYLVNGRTRPEAIRRWNELVSQHERRAEKMRQIQKLRADAELRQRGFVR